MRDIADVQRLAEEHLTAASVMVKLSDPLSPEMRVLDARRYLEAEEHDFDLALVAEPSLAIVTRKRLRGLTSKADLGREISNFTESPRRDRLIERTTPIRHVASRLADDDTPLLVVGESGVTHIVTLSDFGGVAGTAVVLAYVLAVDGLLNELLQRHADEAWEAVDEDQQAEAMRLRDQAEAEGGALELLDYLSMGTRLHVLRKLGLQRKYDLLDRPEHKILLNARNRSAHASALDQRAAITAIEISETLLARLAEVLSE